MSPISKWWVQTWFSGDEHISRLVETQQGIIFPWEIYARVRKCFYNRNIFFEPMRYNIIRRKAY
jgi:hypothetical protein